MQQTLLDWFNILYRVSSQPKYTLAGSLGTWPAQMKDVLELLLLAHAPRRESASEVARVRTSRATRIAPPGNTGNMRTMAEPGMKPVCWLLFAGGKDALAAGVLSERAGYDVHAIYVSKLNQSYPNEGKHAEAIAEQMGWRFTRLDPTLPELVLKVRGISVIRNPYILALTFEKLAEQMQEPLPAAYCFGSYGIDDCLISSHFSEYEVCYRAMHALLQERYGAAMPERLPPLADPRDAFRIWLELPEAVQQLTASCMMPLRNKALHRAQLMGEHLSPSARVPLLDYECGRCYKCVEKAVLLALMGAGDAYPERYVEYARHRVASLIRQKIDGVNPDARLQTPWLAEHGYGDMTSLEYLWYEVFAGTLPGPLPAGIRKPHIEAVVDMAPHMRTSNNHSAPAPAAPSASQTLRDRITRLERVRASDLVPNPKNWRKHGEEQRQAFREVVAEVGFAGAELVRVLPDGRFMLVDGHMRHEEMGDQVIPVLVTDLDEAEADAILATYDPIARMADVNQHRIETLVQDIRRTGYGGMADVLQAMRQRDEELRAFITEHTDPVASGTSRAYTDGVGYADDIDLDGDSDDLGEPWDPAAGGDSARTEAGTPQRSMQLAAAKGGQLGDGYHLLIECADERQLRAAYAYVQEGGYSCRVLTL